MLSNYNIWIDKRDLEPIPRDTRYKHISELTPDELAKVNAQFSKAKAKGKIFHTEYDFNTYLGSWLLANKITQWTAWEYYRANA